MLSKGRLYLFIFLLPVVSFASESCSELIQKFNPSASKIGISKVKDYYRVLNNFPKIEFNHIRAIHRSEVENILNSFFELEITAREFSKRFTGFENLIIQDYSNFIKAQIEIFINDYNSFQPTSYTLDRLIKMSALIQGRGFEMLLGAILHRSGYMNIKRNIRIGKNEIDVLGTKDGRRFFFEAKSLKPETENDRDSFFEENLAKIVGQVSKMKQTLIDSGHGSDQYVLVFHFSLGDTFKHLLIEAGADKVIYLRKKYLDDYEKY